MGKTESRFFKSFERAIQWATSVLFLHVNRLPGQAHDDRTYLVFQQIDIEEYSAAGAGPEIRAFGVTKVSSFCEPYLPLVLTMTDLTSVFL